ncbi:MAG: alanine-tRNA synthetase second additional domain-containing protein [Firmicutes bacterium]|nr:alanine-tRNA synthetase second additional domain-containing protein [Bacillota bacterium]
MYSITQETLIHATYFAPRGKNRLQLLGFHLAQRYLSPDDRLIGFVGDSGAGKSLLIRGMFPGLELTNDDEGVNIRPLPLSRQHEDGRYLAHTYHVDARFEIAFQQGWQLADSIRDAVMAGKRVVVEHFDHIYPVLKMNPAVLIGVGEEVIITRPGVFGPLPGEISGIVYKSIQYRKMVHTAEDLTSKVLVEMGYERPKFHSDIRHGFLLEFPEKPEFDLEYVEKRVKELIEADLDIHYHDEDHIRIGKRSVFPCSGPRIHVRRTSEIKGFRLLKEIQWDPVNKLYYLAGMVGEKHTGGIGA